MNARDEFATGVVQLLNPHAKVASGENLAIDTGPVAGGMLEVATSGAVELAVSISMYRPMPVISELLRIKTG